MDGLRMSGSLRDRQRLHRSSTSCLRRRGVNAASEIANAKASTHSPGSSKVGASASAQRRRPGVCAASVGRKAWLFAGADRGGQRVARYIRADRLLLYGRSIAPAAARSVRHNPVERVGYPPCWLDFWRS